MAEYIKDSNLRGSDVFRARVVGQSPWLEEDLADPVIKSVPVEAPAPSSGNVLLRLNECASMAPVRIVASVYGAFLGIRSRIRQGADTNFNSSPEDGGPNGS